MVADGVRTGRSLIHHSVGDADGTRKFLLQLQDGRIVETVGIPTADRLTVCVSSQVGPSPWPAARSSLMTASHVFGGSGLRSLSGSGLRSLSGSGLRSLSDL